MSYREALNRKPIQTLLALTWLIVAHPAGGQGIGPTSATGLPPAYVSRGDEVEKRYKAHRENLEGFFKRFGAVLDTAAPELKKKILPPADVPYGYGILPAINPDPPATKQTRIRLSPFSWRRTDSVITRERDSLVLLETRLERVPSLAPNDRHAEYAAIADEYRKLGNGQRFIANLVQYNRLWQSEITRRSSVYQQEKLRQDAAIKRQELLDSIAHGKKSNATMKKSLDSVTAIVDEAIRKSVTPSYITVSHPDAHRWIVNVPMYTDIDDAAWLDKARTAIEDGWHVRDGADEFRVKLDIRRVTKQQLYPAGDAPKKGAHIDISKHTDRFPPGRAILTTGGNLTYIWGRAMIIGPHALARRVLVHEFGHLLGFKDGYFRASRGESADGYQVVEVILVPDEIVAAPEDGHARREHFEQLLAERVAH
jgi:hypothetical protein